MLQCRECESKAVVKSVERISDIVMRRYYQCTNVMCGHTFRTSESFDHTISPPAGRNQQMLLGLFYSMPEEDQKDLINKLR